jgi:hypothetical protein
MNINRGRIGWIVLATLCVLLVSGAAYAQGPERRPVGPAAWDNDGRPDALVGGMIGGFLGQMLQNNWNRDRYRYEQERRREWERRHRHSDRYHRRYGDRRPYWNDPDYRYGTGPYSPYVDRYPYRDHR